MRDNAAGTSGFEVIRELEMSVAPFPLHELDEIEKAANFAADVFSGDSSKGAGFRHLSEILKGYDQADLILPPEELIGLAIGSTALSAGRSQRFHDIHDIRVHGTKRLSLLRKGLMQGTNLGRMQADKPFLDIARSEVEVALESDEELYRIMGIGAGYRAYRLRPDGVRGLAA
jgi:hypothetical protein